MSYEQLEAKRSRRQDLEDRHGPSDDVRESSLHKRLEQLVRVLCQVGNLFGWIKRFN